MKNFRDLSIKTKLIGIQLLTTFIVLLFFGIYVVYDEWKEYQSSAKSQLTSTTLLLSSNSISSLRFLDTLAAEEVLSSLKSQKDIVNAWIYDRDGKLFAKYYKKAFKNYSFPKTALEQIHFTKEFIIISKKIIDDNEFLGMISLRLDASERWDSLLQNEYIIIIALFSGMIIAFILAALIQKKISGPILKLANKSEQVTKTGDYSLRIEDKSTDEIGHLSASFNTMLKQIQSREIKLKDAREHLQTVLDAVPSTISWINSDLNYLGVNHNLAVQFNLTPEEFIGKPIDFKESDSEFVETVRTFFKSEEKRIFKEIHSTFNKTTHTLLLVGQKYADNKAAVFIGVDITKIKEAEKQTKTSEARFSLVLEASNTGIWDFDILNNKAYYSPRWKAILGFKEDEVEYSSDEWEKRLHPDEKDIIIQKFDDYLANPKDQLTIEYRLKHNDGSYRWINDRSVALVDEYGKSFRILGSISDITKRKMAEEELLEAHNDLELKVARRTKELADANIKLQELDQLKSMFLASMSHELRTPLNSIIGFTGLLLMDMAGEMNKEQKKQLGMVKNSASHLLSLINDILDISKIESGKIDLDIEKFKINELITETIESTTPLAEAKDLKLIRIADHHLVINSDKRRVKQILVNLLSNAIKFTDIGSVQVLFQTISNDFFSISIVDTGIGIKPEDLNKLFKPFQQMDMSSTKKHEGTGLGLHLSRKLVSLLGGSMEVKSEYGKGSTFIFTLPINFKIVKKDG